MAIRLEYSGSYFQKAVSVHYKSIKRTSCKSIRRNSERKFADDKTQNKHVSNMYCIMKINLQSISINAS